MHSQVGETGDWFAESVLWDGYDIVQVHASRITSDGTSRMVEVIGATVTVGFFNLRWPVTGERSGTEHVYDMDDYSPGCIRSERQAGQQSQALRAAGTHDMKRIHTTREPYAVSNATMWP